MSLRPVSLLTLFLVLAAAVSFAASAPSPAPVETVDAIATEAAEAGDCALRLDPAPVSAASGWTFEGCFTFFPAGPCRDAYRDSGGQLWLCGACGTTNNPGPGKCSKISGSGWWCS